VELALFLYAYYHSRRYILRNYLVEWELDLTLGCTGDRRRVRDIRNPALGALTPYIFRLNIAHALRLFILSFLLFTATFLASLYLPF